MMMKNILGVHGKTSKLALHAELGLFPLCFKAFKLMFRYYTRLIQLEEKNDFFLQIDCSRTESKVGLSTFLS
jgi:hypothetical protein